LIKTKQKGCTKRVEVIFQKRIKAQKAFAKMKRG